MRRRLKQGRLATAPVGNAVTVGVSLILALVLGLVGLGALFVSPWLGASALAAAVILGLLALVGTAADVSEVAADADEPVEAPHLPGPGNPASGVE